MFDYLVPLAVAGGIFGFRWKEGFWGNFITLFNVFFSVLLAIGYWESLAVILSGYAGTMLFLTDFICIWGIFLISLALLNELTKFVSNVKIKFAIPVESAGNGVALLITTLLVLCFYWFALDLAPIGENRDVATPADSALIQATRMLSAGNFASFFTPTQFDADGTFRADHLHRRQSLMINAETNPGVFSGISYSGTVPPRKK
ncbi:MAG: hypothetical protein ACRCUY_05050 [Thermoguttaceae bacterium]